MKLSRGALCVVLAALVILLIGVVQAIARGPAYTLNDEHTPSTVSSQIDTESVCPNVRN